MIEAEAGAIEHYTRIIEACDGVDWATQDMVIDILRDEENHLRTFERYLVRVRVRQLAYGSRHWRVIAQAARLAARRRYAALRSAARTAGGRSGDRELGGAISR